MRKVIIALLFFLSLNVYADLSNPILHLGDAYLHPSMRANMPMTNTFEYSQQYDMYCDFFIKEINPAIAIEFDFSDDFDTSNAIFNSNGSRLTPKNISPNSVSVLLNNDHDPIFPTSVMIENIKLLPGERNTSFGLMNLSNSDFIFSCYAQKQVN